MKWQNQLTGLLKIEYPIIAAPMLGVTTPEMVAAVSNEGGLGSLAVGGLPPEKTSELIRKTKDLTNKPFAVNIFAYDIDVVNIWQAEAMQVFLEQLCADNKINFEKQAIETMRFYSYKDQIEILVDEQVPVISFTFGIPSDEVIKTLKDKGIILNGTATCTAEAMLLEQKGVDIITAQGIEAGGHRGTFLKSEPLPAIGLMSLIPQVVNHVNIPVLAAGGINDGKTINAAFILGASGVQIGTAFIASDESAAIPSYKDALQNTSDVDSVLTRSFSGRWARGIKNKFMAAVENSGMTIPEYPVQNALTTPLRRMAQKQNNKDFTNLWAGQSTGNAQRKPIADIFIELIQQTAALNLR